MVNLKHPDLQYYKIRNKVGLRLSTSINLKNFLIKKKSIFYTTYLRKNINSYARNKIRRTSLYKPIYVRRSNFKVWSILLWTIGYRYFITNNTFWTFGLGIGGSIFSWGRINNDKKFNFFVVNCPLIKIFFKKTINLGILLAKAAAPQKICYITNSVGMPKYSRAPGTTSLFKFQIPHLFYGLVFLPSNQKKIFLLNSFFFLRPNVGALFTNVP